MPNIKNLLAGPVESFFFTPVHDWNLWLLQMKELSAETAFTFLELEKAGEHLLNTPRFHAWVKYVTLIDNDYPEAVMAAVLAAHYGDDGIAKMLETSIQIGDTNDIVIRLQLRKMDSWIKQKISLENALASLELEKAGGNLLSTSYFQRWAKLMAQTRINNLEAAMASILAAIYGDVVLARMLEASRKVTATKDLASKLQLELMKKWMKNIKKVDNVFDKLELENKVDTLFNDLELNTGVEKLFATDADILTAFLTVSEMEEGEMKGTIVINEFRKFYGDTTVAEMLGAAKMKSRTRKRAEELQLQHSQQWRMEGKTPETIQKLLLSKGTSLKGTEKISDDYRAFYNI